MDITAPAYDELNFSKITTEKLTHYSVIGQKCADIIKKELQGDEAAIQQVYNDALEKWKSEAGRDNLVFPLRPFTIENVHAFYESCDKICDADLDSEEISHRPLECVFFFSDELCGIVTRVD